MPAAHAFTMTFSESQLNTMVTAVFPQQRTFDDVVFTFSDPFVVWENQEALPPTYQLVLEG